jgi:serine/threonine protein phosphatase 1
VRTLAIGDIHGCGKALRALAESVPIRPSDTIVVLGDFVDRGPETRGVIDWLLEVERRGKLVALRGNHEVMMLQAREDELACREWLECGGDAALASYSRPGERGRLDDIPERHWEFLEQSTRAWYETNSHFFVHANAYPYLALEDQPDYMLYWEKFDHPPPHESGKVMVCGHTPQRSGIPRSIGHAVCLDTGACRGGWLTCLDVDSGVYWQANQAGATRIALLEESLA